MSTYDNRPVFVLLTATTCSACVGFKANVLPSLLEALQRQNKVQVVTIEVPDTRTKPDSNKYHPGLSRFIGWFPMMALVPASRWFNHSSELVGIVKNGKMVPPTQDENGNTIPEHIEIVGRVNMSEEDIMNWINFTINNPEGMFQRLASEPVIYSVRNSVSTNTNTNNTNTNNTNTTNIQKTSDGKYKVPTSGYYAKFKPSKAK